MSNTQTKVFRTDINGLRAWAVGIVILFHFGVPGFEGGYIGVDVFFVISGFLMTGIIARSLQDGAAERPLAFLWNFYLARGKRILPALLVLCATLLIIGYFLLSDDEYMALGRQTTSAVLFFSNITFWRETGYFAPNAHDLWLLHTWSLSVEWQFYLLLPVGALFAWRLRPSVGVLQGALLCTGLASLALCLVASQVLGKPTTAFFMLPCRAWEMIAGGLVALTPRRPPQARRTRLFLQALGFALIALTTASFGHIAWPDWRAIFPVLGASLVIFSAAEDSLLTRGKLIQWIGRCSYSMYLWHWPLVIAIYYIERQHQPLSILSGLIATAVIGYLSFRWFETALRRPLDRGVRGSMMLIGATAAMLVPGALIARSHGYAARLSPEQNAMFAGAKDRFGLRDCQIIEHGNDAGCLAGGSIPAVVVLGDSHGLALMPAVRKALPDSALGALQWSVHGCATMMNLHNADEMSLRCDRFMEWVMQRLPSVPSNVPVLIINRTAMYMEGSNRLDSDNDSQAPIFYFATRHRLRGEAFYTDMRQHLIETTCAIAKNHTVYLMRPVPEMQVNVPMVQGRAMIIGRQRDISVSLDEYRNRNVRVIEAQDAASKLCGVHILDPLPYLCHDGRCNAVAQQRSMYYDDNHINVYGSNFLVPMFAQIFTPKSSPSSPQRDK